MTTPKEKAAKLVEKFRNEITSFLSDTMKDMNAKKCAIIHVEEIINEGGTNVIGHGSNYYKEVKKEIELL